MRMLKLATWISALLITTPQHTSHLLIIFQDRHILIVNAPLQNKGFSIITLNSYTNITKTVEILD